MSIVWVIIYIVLGIISVTYVTTRINNVVNRLKNINSQLSSDYGTLIASYNEIELKHAALAIELEKIVHQKKSSEVRLGKIGENLAPFTNGWPWDSNNFRFIGNPIDGIQFTDDEIIFVEIKTGKSRLSKGQTLCKDLINKGKVRFVSFRIGEDGTTLTEN